MTKLQLHIDGMTCMGCVKSVERALGAQKGITKVAVDLASNSAVIEYDAQTISPNDIISAIDDAGFGASLS